LIWENFILTAAHCAANDEDVPPDVARMGDLNIYSDDDDEFPQQLRIVKVIRHQQHRFSAKYYDVALMQLEKNITVHETVAPACLWLDDEVRFPKLYAAGWGRTGFGEDKTNILLKVDLTPMNNTQCSKFYTSSERGLRNGLHAHHLCAGDEKMDTCPGDSGGPLHVKLLHNAKMTPFLVGVTSFGKPCGQANPGVYARVSSFVEWIIETLQKEGELATVHKFQPWTCALRYVHVREYEDDVVVSRSNNFETYDSDKAHLLPFPVSIIPACVWYNDIIPDPQFEVIGKGRADLVGYNRDERVTTLRSKDEVIFIDPDLRLNDRCSYSGGVQGVCVAHDRCPSIRQRMSNGDSIIICSGGSVAEVGWEEGSEIRFQCIAYLISTRAVVTSASCLVSKEFEPTVVRLGNIRSGPQTTNIAIIPISTVEIHPEFNQSTFENNIALLKLTLPVQPTVYMFPGCLWQNKTHSPVESAIFRGGNGFDPIHPMYVRDCNVRFARTFSDPRITCMVPGVYGTGEHCYPTGSPIIFRQNEDTNLFTEYLVNIYSHGRCNSTSLRIVHRIAMYIDWFKEVLK
uniref:Peptidase S1 domain-containing protein n=1 Tax=Anopheles coluzzii TaxID=1518534 RepID=A0A8W7Q2R0_ANOCL